METPHMKGLMAGDLSDHELIGKGACGAVFSVKHPDGLRVALKMFDDAAIQRALLEKMTRRLEAGGWPDGVLPVIAADYQAAAAFRVMPLMADGGDGETPVPRSLQHRLGEHPGFGSWKLVKALARALAAMHARRVPHGNLKPGNVFLNDRGEPLLTDWSLGNMPGVKHFEFTDAVLYQAPEQLRHPAGYLDEAGYGWDVFSFGALAYRILTGKFPRCHETFSQVAPPQGETRRKELRADLAKVAQNLATQAEIKWPEEKCCALESRMRGWINRCLDLDPAKRPYDMIAVVAGIEAAEKELVAEPQRQGLVARQQLSSGRALRAFPVMAVALVLGLAMALLWQVAHRQIADANARHANGMRALKAALELESQQRQAADERGVLAEETLARERQAWLARLEGSLETGDLLFSWALEQGRRQLPPLDGRKQRLKLLEARFEKFLTHTADDPDLVEERSRVRLQLAEISLAAGDSKAASRLEDALRICASLPMNAEMKLRVATNTLWLALLKQAAGDQEAAAAFETARKALGAVPRAEADADRLDHLLATLDFHEAKLLAARGDETRALELLMRASQTLNLISDRRPDTSILRSELASCHLTTANIFDGAGEPGDADELRKLAAAELRKLLVKNPDDHTLRLELAACYAAMAESAILAGDVSSAESLSREAIKLLDQLLAAQPDQVDAISHKAAQFGLRAGILRDRGQSAEAMQSMAEGIRMLESLRASAPGDAMVAFSLAQLWWQKGRMVGANGGRDEEIALLGRARDLLDSLLAAPQVSGPLPGQLRRAGAYLAGDLGHALQLANRKGDAARAFLAAVSLWEELLKSNPQNEENLEGLSWSRQRLEDIR